MVLCGAEDEAYRRAMGDAHRLPTTKFRAPALVWHQAFWIMQRSNDETVEGARVRAKNDLDKFILNIWKPLHNAQQSHFYPRLSNNIILFNNAASVDSLELIALPRTLTGNVDSEAVDPDQRAIFDSDYRVIILKFKWNELDTTIRFELHGEYFSISTFIEVGSLDYTSFADFHINIEYLKTYCSKQSNPYLQIAAYLKGLFANGAHDAIVTKSADIDQIKTFFYYEFWRKFSESVFCIAEESERLFQHVLADFRGAVISDETLQIKDARMLQQIESSKWAEHVLGKCLPLIEPIGVDALKCECTITYMLGGRALYMTALGPQVPGFVGQRIPVTYLLYVHQRTLNKPRVAIVNRWQLGRLVGLLHQIGTNRLAALKDLGALRDVGNKLAMLDEKIVFSRHAVSENSRDLHSSKEDDPFSIKAAHTYFNCITQVFNTKTETTHGILYRVERSRYYTQRFRNSIRQLRIDRVEGHLKYDSFVERRLGPTFDFIDRLGKRYERAVASLTLLDSYNLSIQSNSTSKRIAEIQYYGEIALIGVLLPYYAVSLIHHIASEETAWYMAIVVWAFALFVALRRMFKIEKMSYAIGLVIVMLIGLGVVDSVIVPRFEYFISNSYWPEIKKILGGIEADSENSAGHAPPQALNRKSNEWVPIQGIALNGDRYAAFQALFFRPPQRREKLP